MKSFTTLVILLAVSLALMTLALDLASPLAHTLTRTGAPFFLAIVGGAKLLNKLM